MLDYAGLEALAAVVREGSFERAAHKLHVTPSAVSQRIKQLEERIARRNEQNTADQALLAVLIAKRDAKKTSKLSAIEQQIAKLKAEAAALAGEIPVETEVTEVTEVTEGESVA